MSRHTYLFSVSEQCHIQHKHKENHPTDTPHCFRVQGAPGALTNHIHTNTTQPDFCVQRTQVLIVWDVKGKVRESANWGSISPLPITGEGLTKEVEFLIIK